MKDKLTLKALIIIGIIIIGIYEIPKFLNFMETQKDILKLKNTQVFSVSKDYNKPNLSNISQISYNVPTPKDIREKNFKEYQEKIRQKQLEIERQKVAEQQRLEEERKIEEQKRIAQQKENERKISKTKSQIQETTITSRGEEKPRSNSNSYITFTATGYCPCSKCCGKSNGRTAMGTIAQQGRTVAMPSSYKFGTKIEIENMGTFTVEDRGGAIQGNRIDIFFSTHQQALSFGKRQVRLKVL